MEKEQEKELTEDKVTAEKNSQQLKTDEKEKSDSSEAEQMKEEKWEREELQEKDLDKVVKTPAETRAKDEVAAALRSELKATFVLQSSDEDQEDQEDQEDEDICMGGAGSRPLSVEPRTPELQMFRSEAAPQQITVIIPTLTMQEPSVDEDLLDLHREGPRLTPDLDQSPPDSPVKPELLSGSTPEQETTSVSAEETASSFPASTPEPTSAETKPEASTGRDLDQSPQRKQSLPQTCPEITSLETTTRSHDKQGKEAEREMEGERDVASPGFSQPSSYFILDRESKETVHTGAPEPESEGPGGDKSTLAKETDKVVLRDQEQTSTASKYDPYEKPVPIDQEGESSRGDQVSADFHHHSDLGPDDNRRSSQAEGGGASFPLDDQDKEEPLSFSRVDYNAAALSREPRSATLPRSEDREKGQEEEKETQPPDQEKISLSRDMRDNRVSLADESFSPKEDKPERSDKDKEHNAAAAAADQTRDSPASPSAAALQSPETSRQEASYWNQSNLWPQVSAAPGPSGELAEKDQDKLLKGQATSVDREGPGSSSGRCSPAEKDILPTHKEEETLPGARSPQSQEHARDPNVFEADNSRSSSSDVQKATVVDIPEGKEALIDKRLLVEGEDFDDDDEEDDDEDGDEDEEDLSDVDMEKGAREESEKEMCRQSSDRTTVLADKKFVDGEPTEDDVLRVADQKVDEDGDTRRPTSPDKKTTIQVEAATSKSSCETSPDLHSSFPTVPVPSQLPEKSFSPEPTTERRPEVLTPSPDLSCSKEPVEPRCSGGPPQSSSPPGPSETKSSPSSPPTGSYADIGRSTSEGFSEHLCGEEYQVTAEEDKTETPLLPDTSNFSRLASDDYFRGSREEGMAEKDKPATSGTSSSSTSSFSNSSTTSCSRPPSDSPSVTLTREVPPSTSAAPHTDVTLIREDSSLQESSSCFGGYLEVTTTTRPAAGGAVGARGAEEQAPPSVSPGEDTRPSPTASFAAAASTRPGEVDTRSNTDSFCMLEGQSSTFKVPLTTPDMAPPTRADSEEVTIQESHTKHTTETVTVIAAPSRPDWSASLSDGGTTDKNAEPAPEERLKTAALLEEDAQVCKKESKEEGKKETAGDGNVQQPIKKEEEVLCKDSVRAEPAGPPTLEDRSLWEEPEVRLEGRRRSSLSDWELLQRPDDLPAALPTSYCGEEDRDQEDVGWMSGVHQTSSSSSKDTCHSKTSGGGAAQACHSTELSTGPSSSHQPSSHQTSSSTGEHKQRRGDLSPSFINPSPQQLSSEEAEEEEEEACAEPCQEAGEDDREQHSVKRRSHKHRRHHQADASLGPHQLPGATSSTPTVTLAGEETPPTSASESLPSQSDSDVPPETEECPSITPEGNLDSDEDAEHLPVDKLSSASGAATSSHRPQSPRSSQKSLDPPPAPVKDPLPHPPRPDVCMVDPEALLNHHGSTEKLLKRESKTTKGMRRVKTKSASPARKGEVKKRSPTPVKQASKDSSASPRSASLRRKETDKSSRLIKLSENHGSRGEIFSPGKGLLNGVKSASGNNPQKTSSAVPPGPPVYVDLAYVPNHCSAKNVDQEFFKRVRAAYYVVSGNDPGSEEPSRGVLDALLEGKAQWGSNLQVTLIPTHDTEVTRDWYQQTHERQQDLNIMVLASSSTVVMQDESFPACKIEF